MFHEFITTYVHAEKEKKEGMLLFPENLYKSLYYIIHFYTDTNISCTFVFISHHNTSPIVSYLDIPHNSGNKLIKHSDNMVAYYVLRRIHEAPLPVVNVTIL